ncbi:hypothetical protein [Pseudomonas sp. Pseu.R1]|uniref:hypothetical protein n=1 Tax=Pseudomonas sp. Pseu.R1 TaxID=3379818 RepID=UPI003B962FA6
MSGFTDGHQLATLAGYAHLIDAMGLKVIGVKKPARVQPVTRIERLNGALAVPRAVAPEAGDFLAHIIFALKHEGVNLAILAQALPRIEDRILIQAMRCLVRISGSFLCLSRCQTDRSAVPNPAPPYTIWCRTRSSENADSTTISPTTL